MRSRFLSITNRISAIGTLIRQTRLYNPAQSGFRMMVWYGFSLWDWVKTAVIYQKKKVSEEFDLQGLDSKIACFCLHLCISRKILRNVQELACICISGAMRTKPHMPVFETDCISEDRSGKVKKVGLINPFDAIFYCYNAPRPRKSILHPCNRTIHPG